MKAKLINKQNEIDELTKLLHKQNIIALDTEFARRDTYFAKLALIQLAFDKEIYIIDALSTNLSGLWQKIIESNALIIIHAGRQDLEIFYHLFHLLPQNIIDTQIAAKLCGFRSDVSYAELCLNICDVTIDKKYQAANWLSRDISAEMLEYAALDVFYLEKIYHHLKQIIDSKELGGMLQEQVQKSLLDPYIYKLKPEEAWRKIRFSNRRESFCKAMQVLAAFREESAIKLNIPRGFFITDKQLIQLCDILPATHLMISQIRNMKYLDKFPEYKAKLLDLCAGLSDEAVLI